MNAQWQWKQWNEEQPSAPGWYWLGNPQAEATIDNPMIVFVEPLEDRPHMLVLGKAVAYPIEPGLVALWAGPLNAPEVTCE